MPYAPSDPGPMRVPGEDVPYWDGGHYGGGYGGPPGPYAPQGGGFNFGGVGGSSFGATSRYPNFPGMGTDPRRKQGMGAYASPMGASMAGPQPSFASSSWLPNPASYAPGGGGATSPGGPPGTFNPSDYYAKLMARFNGSDTGYTHAGGTDLESIGDYLLGGGQGSGFFSAQGDPRTMQAYQQDATRRGLAQEQSAVTGAKIDGADPWTQSLARTMARTNAQRSSGDFYNQYHLGQANHFNDLLKFFAEHKLGEYDAQKQQQWGQNAADAQRKHENSLFPWQIGGQLLGAGIGAYAGKH